MNFFRFGFVVGMAVADHRCRCSATGRPTDGQPPPELAPPSGARPSCKRALGQLRDYNRPDFHPDDSDTNELVERWRKELFGEYGTLNDKLVTARRPDGWPTPWSTSTS
jgi:hypothetical protein